MSTLPTEDQARESCAFMAQEIHVPAFFEKLAQYDIRPKTEAEAQQMLQYGALLHQAEQNGQLKTATETDEGNPFLAHVINKLAAVQPSEQQTTDYVEKLAHCMAADNDIARMAALVYGHVVAGGDVQPAEAAVA